MARFVVRLGAAVTLVATVALGAAGCAARTGGSPAPTDAETVSAPTSAVTSGAPASAAATPTPTPAPTQAAGEWGVSAEGIGPLRLGRSWSELVADPEVGLTGSLEQCATAFVMKPGYQFSVTFPAGEHGDDAALPTVTEVSAMPVGDPAGAASVHGAAGVTFGSSSAAVLAAYPDGTWGVPSFNPELERIYVVGNGPITFGFAGDALKAIVVGGRDVPYEYCG